MIDKDFYTSDIATEYPEILSSCIVDAIRRGHEEGVSGITDIRMWVQKWHEISCGRQLGMPKVLGAILAPTVLIKFHRGLRYVYHDGVFAYAIRGQVSIRYYDCTNLRRLPGAADPERLYLTADGI